MIPRVDLKPCLIKFNENFFSKYTVHAKRKFGLILLGINYHLFAIKFVTFTIKIYPLAQNTIVEKYSYISNGSATQLEGIQTDKYWTKA